MQLTLVAAKRSGACLVHSDIFKRALVQGGVPEDKIHIAADAVGGLQPALPGKDAELAALHGLQDRFVFGYVGEVGGLQCPDVLVDVAAALAPRFPQIRLLIAGTGDQIENLHKKRDRPGLREHVVLVEDASLANVPKLQSLLDVGVFARKETLAGHLVPQYDLRQAMAFGKPVVAYRTREAASLVKDGYDGLLADPGDSDSLARAIGRLLADKALFDHLGGNASAYARYARSRIDSQLDRIYREMSMHHA